jgi:predicted TIM-barrel enzyme
MRFTRIEILDRLREQVRLNRPIVGAGAGSGLSAKFIERGGADFLVVYSSGRFRMSGHSSLCGLLPLCDANATVLEMGEREVLPVAREIPVIAGVNGTDPTRDLGRFLRVLADAGFSGVNNFPTVGLFDGKLRQGLEATGLGFDREIEMLGTAHEQDMFTIAYVFTPAEAAAMTGAGVDVVIAHMGLTVGGSVGMDADVALTLDDSCRLVQEIAEAASAVRDSVMVLCHGGPIAEPGDAAYVIERTSAVGFVGASSIERLPVEKALTKATQAFKMPNQTT